MSRCCPPKLRVTRVASDDGHDLRFEIDDRCWCSTGTQQVGSEVAPPTPSGEGVKEGTS